MIKKLYKIVILLIVGCLFCANSSASGGVKCSNWINANINTNDAISSAGYLLDGSGRVGSGNISAVCRDVSWVTGDRFSIGAVMGFPDIFTRTKLVRQGSDAFNSAYSLSKQLCSFRDISNKMECSFSFLKCSGIWYDPSTWRCAWVVLGDAWGSTNTSSPIYMYNGASAIWNKDINFRGNEYCLKRYTNGDKMSHGGTYGGSQDYVCAYLGGGCNTARFDCLQAPMGINEAQCWRSDLIGCVHELPRPSPPIYNKALVQAPNPYVDQGNNQAYGSCTGISDSDLYNTCVLQNYYVQTFGSKFHQPVISLKKAAYGVQGSINYVPASTLTLRYVYPGDVAIDSLPRCGTMGSVSYCAVSVSSDYPTVPPSQVCICDINYCSQGSYLGCIPRPNLKQSGYALVVDYLDGNEPNNFFGSTSNQYNPGPNATVKFVQTDSIGPLIYDASNSRVRKWPADRKYYKVDAMGAFYILNGNSNTIDPQYIAQYPVHYGATLPATFTDGSGSEVFSIGEYSVIYSPSPTLSTIGNSIIFANPSNPTGYTLDSMSTYGASISAVMPQISSSTNQPILAGVYSTTPVYNSAAPSNNIMYSISAVNGMSSTGPINYYVPDGSRYRVACNGIHSNNGTALCSGDCVQCNYNNSIASYFQDYTNPPAAINSAYCQNNSSGVLLTPNTTPALQCCAGKISAYVTQGYADSAVCTGAYISDYSERNSNYLVNKNSISAVSGNARVLYNIASSLPNGSTPFTNINNTETATGSPIYQAQNICIYSTDWDFIGYNLNSTNDAYDDPQGLNAYLCDHIPQRCEKINLTTGTPVANVYMPIENIAKAGVSATLTSTGYASWPKTEYNPTSTRLVGTTATGTCASGYSMANGSSSPTRSCLDGEWGGINSGSCLAKCGIPTSGAGMSLVGYGMSFGNPQPSGRSILGSAPSQYLVAGTTATATTCSSSFRPIANNLFPSITCKDDGTFDMTNGCSAYCNLSEGTASTGYATGFTTLGTSSPYILDGVSTTATSCIANYNENGSNWPTVTCNGSTGVLSVANACTPSCNIENGAANVGYGTFTNTTINGSVTATGCTSGYIPSSPGVYPGVRCEAGVLSTTITNACVPGCSAFTAPTGTIFSDTGAKANGSSVTGTCNESSGYYGSCSAPSGALTIIPPERYPGCAVTANTITYTCNGSTWEATGVCDNNSCNDFTYGNRGSYDGSLASGSSDHLDCGNGYKEPPIYYCRNGTWSYKDGDGSGTGSAGRCKKS